MKDIDTPPLLEREPEMIEIAANIPSIPDPMDLPNDAPVGTERQWKRFAYYSVFGFLILFIGSALLPEIPMQALLNVGSELLDDRIFWLMILAGFLAQLVDGALGMGYGLTCTAALLGIGIPLPAISGSIHAAELFSSGASGFSHYKFGNVNKKLFKTIVIPGVAGAILGACLLSWLGRDYSQYTKPFLACYTMFLGTRLLMGAFKKKSKEKPKVKRAGWLAGIGGFMDSFGGGGWGPLVAGTLISKGKTPRYVIGTVSLTEFFVTLTSALTFFTTLGFSHWQVILGLIIGGVAAAPIAAKLTGKLPIKTMLISVGVLVIIWSVNILVRLLL